MNDHIKHIAWLLQETYNGHPWHGRSIKALLGEVSAEEAVKKPGNNSFSIAELVYHMYTWRDFTITRLRPEEGKNAQYYEENDWRKLNLTDPQVWQRGLQLLDESQQRLV